MKNQASERTLVTLANASELVVGISQSIIGNEVADTFNGSPLSRELIHHLAQTTFQSNVAQYLGGK